MDDVLGIECARSLAVQHLALIETRTSEMIPEQIHDLITDLKRLAQDISGLSKPEILEKTAALIAIIDQKLCLQLNKIIHHSDFQQLEGAWRGLHYLVSHTETSDMLQIKVLNLSKAELPESLATPENRNSEQSDLFAKIYKEVYEINDIEPFGCLVGDYYFSQSSQDVEVLASLSKICAVSHTPFLAGANPTIVGLESWHECTDSRDMTGFSKSQEFETWSRLRELEGTRFIGLAMPRFLGRTPYDHEPVASSAFDFTEDTSGDDNSKYLWCNSAYLMATTINRAFAQDGWCVNIRGLETSGAVKDLPAQVFLNDHGDLARNCPIEIALSGRREAELSHRFGLMPLLQKKDDNLVAFISACSLHKPAQYDDLNLTADANLAARFPYLLPACRFAQYLQCMARDNIGSYRDRLHLQEMLQRWIHGYVLKDPWGRNATLEEEVRHPLAAAEIVIAEFNDRFYEVAEFSIKPFYQFSELLGLTATVRLFLRLPKIDRACHARG